MSAETIFLAVLGLLALVFGIRKQKRKPLVHKYEQIEKKSEDRWTAPLDADRVFDDASAEIERLRAKRGSRKND